jgi:hypothetical protein
MTALAYASVLIRTTTLPTTPPPSAVTPGLWILIPCLAATAGSGMYIGKSRRGRLVDNKKKRMPFIAANGLLVLVPCAIFLNRWASAGSFYTGFYVY